MIAPDPPFPVGAHELAEGRWSFCVWAPRCSTVTLELEAGAEHPLEPTVRGYHGTVVASLGEGTRYRYRLDGGASLPDPAARSQPDGVHGASALVSPRYHWGDAGWLGAALPGLVIYELHIGAFTPEGTLHAARSRLPELRDLGVTAVELMPVGQFSGERNWGYDGTYPFAVQNSYGGARALKRFVDDCHGLGLAVILDVVYNHLGPEGNYLEQYGPYFTNRYRTPWGAAVNLDGPGSVEVRRFFIANALQWVQEFHVDGLRLDAVHAIHDRSAQHFLAVLAASVHRGAARCGRSALVIAESELGDPRLVHSPQSGGYGLDAQWQDDLHHALHAYLTGERNGYYEDYGTLRHIVEAWRHGRVSRGRDSRCREWSPGGPAGGLAPGHLVVAAQNHDQVGNRPRGDRLTSLLDREQLKLVAANVLLSSSTPLLFMGEEYGEPAPFPYFVSHSEPALVEAVRRGRAAEFLRCHWQPDPPDPQADATFRSATLQWQLRVTGWHRVLREYYRELLRLRAELCPEDGPDWPEVVASQRPPLIQVRRRHASRTSLAIFHFGSVQARLPRSLPGSWRVALDSAAHRWQGPGSLLPSDLEGSDCHFPLQPYSAVWLVQKGES